jgi:hypothetical protein
VAASGVSDTAEDCSTASAATFRAALASALSFSRQHCLYLRPEPQWHGSLRPGRAIVVAVIEGVYCNRMSSTEVHIAVDNVSDRPSHPERRRSQTFASCYRFVDDSDALMGSNT